MGTRIEVLTPTAATERVRAIDEQLYAQLDRWIANTIASQTNGSNPNSDRFGGPYNHMRDARAQVNSMISRVDLDAMRQYGVDQFNDPAFDIVAEYQNWRDKLNACIDWIDVNVDQSADPPVYVDTTPFTPLLQDLQAASGNP